MVLARRPQGDGFFPQYLLSLPISDGIRCIDVAMDVGESRMPRIRLKKQLSHYSHFAALPYHAPWYPSQTAQSQAFQPPLSICVKSCNGNATRSNAYAIRDWRTWETGIIDSALEYSGTHLGSSRLTSSSLRTGCSSSHASRAVSHFLST